MSRGTEPPSPARRDRRLRRSLAVALLGAPTIWIGLFLAAYLLAEWVCVVEEPERARGSEVLVGAVVGGTGVALVAMAALIRAVWVRHDPAAGDRTGDHADIRLLAGLLGLWFGVGVALVGLPALVLGPCR